MRNVSHAAPVALLALATACFEYQPPAGSLRPGMQLRVTVPASIAVADAAAASTPTGCRATVVDGRLTRISGDTLVLDSSGIIGTSKAQDCLMLHRIAIVAPADGARITQRRLERKRTTTVVAASAAYVGLMFLLSDHKKGSSTAY